MVVTVKCDFCGAPTEKWQAEVERNENSYCNRECVAKAQQKGDGPNVGECDWCGEEFKRNPSAIGKYGGKSFCSRECYRAHQLDQADTTIKECTGCGDLFEVPVSLVTNRHFCSDECQTNHGQSCPECDRDGFKNLAGVKRHYFSAHGEPYDSWRLEDKYGVPLDWLLNTLHWTLNYPVSRIADSLDVSRDWINRQLLEAGAGYRRVAAQSESKPNILTPNDEVPFNWFAIRAVRKMFHEGWGHISRSYRIDVGRCELCGDEREYRQLAAHHIVPIRYGGVNAQENLMALCRDCHTTVEGYTEELFEELFN